MEVVRICDICGSSMEHGKSVAGMEHLDLIECSRCGLVMTSPRPTREEIGAFYPENYYAHVLREPPRWRRVGDRVKSYRGGYPTREQWPKRSVWAVAARLACGLS